MPAPTPAAPAPAARSPGAPAPSAAQGAPGSAGHGRGLTLLVAGSFFMENLDATVIAPVLPQMARSFGTGAVALNVGMSAYLLALAIFIPVSGWTANRFGTRRVYGGAIALFTLASLLCGFSNSLASFVALRVLQGLGGAMMVPVGRLMVLRSTPKDRLIQAIATLTWPALVAPVLGPAIGGFLATHASWRWIFFLNVPLGLAALAVAARLVPEWREATPVPFDWAGFLLSGCGIVLTLGALETVTGDAASSWASRLALPALAGGLVLVALAVRHLRRARHPMLRLDALRLRTFRLTIAGGTLFRMSVSATPFLLPLMLQAGFGYSAFQAGLMTLCVFAGNLAMKTVTTRVLRTVRFRTVLVVNGLLNALAILACAGFDRATPVVLMAAILFAGGMFRSMQFTALNTIAFADIEQPRMADANTLMSTVFQLTIGLGVTVGALAVRGGEAVLPHLGADAGGAAPFRFAFLVTGVIALLAILDCLRLPKEAGASITGRKSA